MKNIKFTILSLTVLLSSTSSLSETNEMGIFVEPSITYEIGDSRGDFPEPLNNSNGDINGFGIGARLGMHVYESFFAGIDGRYSFPKFKDSSVDYNENAVSTNWGPVVGIQMPEIGLRIWANWVLGGQLDPEGTENIDVKFNSAEGYRVGAGMRISIVSINLEYQKLDYSNTSVEQLGIFNSNATFNSVNLDYQTWIASVSFPLEL